MYTMGFVPRLVPSVLLSLLFFWLLLLPFPDHLLPRLTPKQLNVKTNLDPCLCT